MLVLRAQDDADRGVGGVGVLIDPDGDGAGEGPTEGVGVGQARLGGGDEHVSVVSAARPVGGRPHGHPGVGEDVGDGAGQPGGVRAVVDVDGDGDDLGRDGVGGRAGLGLGGRLLLLGEARIGDRQHARPDHEADHRHNGHNREGAADDGGLAVLEPPSVGGTGVCGAAHGVRVVERPAFVLCSGGRGRDTSPPARRRRRPAALQGPRTGSRRSARAGTAPRAEGRGLADNRAAHRRDAVVHQVQLMNRRVRIVIISWRAGIARSDTIHPPPLVRWTGTTRNARCPRSPSA